MGSGVRGSPQGYAVSVRAFHTFRFHCEFHTLCENEKPDSGFTVKSRENPDTVQSDKLCVVSVYPGSGDYLRYEL